MSTKKGEEGEAEASLVGREREVVLMETDGGAELAELSWVEGRGVDSMDIGEEVGLVRLGVSSMEVEEGMDLLKIKAEIKTLLEVEGEKGVGLWKIKQFLEVSLVE